MMKFDRVLAQAEALLVEHPVRTELTEAETKRIADYFYAHELGGDEALREEGIGSDPVFADAHRQLIEEGIEFETPFKVAEQTGSGLSDRMMHKLGEDVSIVLPAAKEALARGNVNFIRYELTELLQLFRINLDHNCADYRKLALAMIKAEVRALEDIRARNRGEPIESPKLIEPSGKAQVSGCSLRAAYEGWDKMEKRPTSTRMEFSRGIERFIELHGDLDVGQINKRHVREFREAAQLVPKHRPGKLKKARLPELVEWTRKNPVTMCIAAATINKWLTCLQGVLNWARKNGVIPDEVIWADPVTGMRLKEPRSKRRPWEPDELSLLFSSSIYLRGERPQVGKGEAAYWLPLLSLFSGARLNELAPMCANDIKHDPSSGVHFFTVVEDDEAGRSVKTENSLRAIPMHPELLRIGFLKFVDDRRKSDGQRVRLFPKIQQNSKGNFGAAFSQWFGRHKRSLGIDNKSSVFHSFRHGFKDALRAADVNEDINDALTGHSGGNPVARGYGSDDMIRRFGFSTLNAAVAKAQYPGLDLSRLRWTPPAKSKQGRPLDL
ncbi:MAG: site-specific integrase [Bradyrhizobium sp.]|nr:site-specific integrase [Bradyrhizobium sp.]